MQWFRMYAEAVDDEKLRLLAFEDRWHFVALLCLKAQGTLDEKNPDLRTRKICVKLGLDSVELETVMKRLETIGLVSRTYDPLAWGKRQFLSDSSTSRVRAFRQRNGNVSVTPSDTDTDTDTEQKQSRTEKKKPKSKSALRATRVPADFLPDLDYARAQCPDIDADREAQKFRDWEFKSPRTDWAACWRTWIGNCRDSGKYAKAAKNGGMMFGGKPVEWQ